MTTERRRRPPEAEGAEAPVEEPSPLPKATRDGFCAICGGPIRRGEEYVSAAYGPVHPEPCSHEPKPLTL